MTNLDTTNIQNITAAKNRRFYLRLSFTQSDGSTPVSFVGKTLKMEVRKNYSGPVFLTFQVGEGLTVASNVITLEKENIDLYESVYLYDLIQFDASGKENIMKGSFIVNSSVTI